MTAPSDPGHTSLAGDLMGPRSGTGRLLGSNETLASPPLAPARVSWAFGGSLLAMACASLALLGCSWASPLGAAAPKRPPLPDGPALLQKGLTAAKTFPLASREVTTRWMSRRTVSTVYRHYRQGSRERLEYLAPRSKAGQIVISTGKGHWHLQPRRKTAVYDPVVDMGARLDMALLRQNYAFQLGPRVETVAERPCYRVVLRPRHAGKGKRIFWLDKATGLSLKTESYHADGSPAGTTYTTDITLGKRLPASLFAVRPAPGTRVTRLPMLAAAKLPPGIQLPATLPGGYHLLSPRPVADPRGRLHLSYFDGIDLLSYYVSPGGAHVTAAPTSRTPRPRRLALVADHHFMIGSWLDGGYDRSLVGDVGPRLMRAIAAAL